MLLAEILGGTLSGLCVGVETRLVLLEEFLLHGNVVVRNAQHDHAILRLSLLLEERIVRLT